MAVVAWEGSSSSIDDATRLSLPRLARVALGAAVHARKSSRRMRPATKGPNSLSTPQKCLHQVQQSWRGGRSVCDPEYSRRAMLTRILEARSWPRDREQPSIHRLPRTLAGREQRVGSGLFQRGMRAGFLTLDLSPSRHRGLSMLNSCPELQSRLPHPHPK